MEAEVKEGDKGAAQENTGRCRTESTMSTRTRAKAARRERKKRE